MKVTAPASSHILEASLPDQKKDGRHINRPCWYSKMLFRFSFLKSLGLAILAAVLSLRTEAGMPNLDKPGSSQAATASPEQPEQTLPLQDIELSKIGPWGQLEYFEALLEAPLELVKASQPTSVRTRWFFGKMAPDAVSAFLQTLKLAQDLETELTDRDRWIHNADGTTIFPKQNVLIALPEPIRALLYRTLSKWPENEYHVEPEIVYGGSVKKWLAGIDLSPQLIDFIEKTSYTTSSSTSSTRLFADTPGVLALAGSERERISILRAFSRTPTLVAKVRIKKGNTHELKSYWNKGVRFKDTSTFLSSMLRYDTLDKIDLVHLLPAEVRKILYTFPRPSLSRSGYLPDCHWSSLNFFNTEPIERLCDPPQATAYTLENFERVSPPYELGDVLFFTDIDTGDAYHSCAYIADDIVFTKNGRSPLQPWVLMKIGKVKDLYDLHYRTNTTAYRRKF